MWRPNLPGNQIWECATNGVKTRFSHFPHLDDSDCAGSIQGGIHLHLRLRQSNGERCQDRRSARAQGLPRGLHTERQNHDPLVLQNRLRLLRGQGHLACHETRRGAFFLQAPVGRRARWPRGVTPVRDAALPCSAAAQPGRFTAQSCFVHGAPHPAGVELARSCTALSFRFRRAFGCAPTPDGSRRRSGWLSFHARCVLFLKAVNEPTPRRPRRAVGPVDGPHFNQASPEWCILGRNLNERAARKIRPHRMQRQYTKPEAAPRRPTKRYALKRPKARSLRKKR
jgi:hypothetical protein